MPERAELMQIPRNANWFQNVKDAREKITAWKEDYNHHRPHSALGYRTPAEFATHAVAAAKAAPGWAPTLNSSGASLASATACVLMPGTGELHL